VVLEVLPAQSEPVRQAAAFDLGDPEFSPGKNAADRGGTQWLGENLRKSAQVEAKR